MSDKIDKFAHGQICEFHEDEMLPAHEERIRTAIKCIVQSCEDERTVDHVGAALIPSKAEIIKILNILQDILFPGFFVG